MAGEQMPIVPYTMAKAWPKQKYFKMTVKALAIYVLKCSCKQELLCGAWFVAPRHDFEC